MMKKVSVALIAVVACLAFALVGCSSSGNTANPTSVSSVTTVSLAPEDIQIVESGLSQEGDYWTYALIVENPNEDKLAERVAVDVTLKDANGTVLYTMTHYLDYLYPLQKAGVAEDTFKLTGTPATLEARATVSSQDWSSSEGIQGGDIDELFEITGLTEMDEGYGSVTFTGEIANGTDDMADMAYITIIFRDSDGQVVGGVPTYANNIPAGGKAAFQTYSYDLPEHASIEAYAIVD